MLVKRFIIPLGMKLTDLILEVQSLSLLVGHKTESFSMDTNWSELIWKLSLGSVHIVFVQQFLKLIFFIFFLDF
jgi:hypothetical protein